MKAEAKTTTTPKSPTAAGKTRTNVSLSPDAIRMAEELASADRRSVSNLFEVLVEREHKKLFPSTQKQAA